ncbi:aminoglycoside phosphotransferase family protein [Microbacterium trichothecenolyticum]|uniref:Phosphotransferase enzyme family protein n=1 Tax=Microbacterium trichothecenolyticum TaxID=69370 RepID=A0A0M2HAT9_MICTR|nr:aminoglycoside phosphotransferase family protein [Microbacterium trichothecenolyticum]KJL43573.1 Phosphotransferase enzyme family protein [Microbacterium trichothecenolyticum]
MTRLPWNEIPPPLRARVEEVLGEPVVEALSQTGGFSPGSADRVITASGRRAFVKSAGLSLNADTPGIHRAEAAITAALPPHVPAPALLGFVEHDDWVALVLEDVEARHPSTPWEPGELEAVLEALHAMTATPLPADAAVTTLADAIAGDAAEWQRIDPVTLPPLPRGLDTWVRAHHDGLTDAAARAVADVRGDRLVHFDTRADNILLREDGSVVLIDWPWAARGVAWFDALSLLINVRYYDPDADIERLIGRYAIFDGMPRDAATRVLAGFAGMFLGSSLRPVPPRMPTLRTFQRDQAIVTLDWLRERWER